MNNNEIEKSEGNQKDLKIMNIQEAAEYMHVPLNTLYKRYYEFPHLKIGSRIYFCKYRLNEYLTQKIIGNRN